MHQRRPKWLRDAKRGPIDLHVLHRAQVIGLIHPRANDVALLETRITVITGPMLRKNCEQHPEMADLYAALPELIRRPGHIARNRDSQIAICYGEVSGQLVRAVICLSDDAEKRGNSVFSYRKCLYYELLSAE